MTAIVPLTERLDAIGNDLREALQDVRRGRRRQPADTISDVMGDLAGIRSELVRLADAARGHRPTLADGLSRAAPMTLERAADLLVGPRA